MIKKVLHSGEIASNIKKYFMGVIPKKGESIEATEKALEANKAFIIIIIIDVFGPSSVYTHYPTGH